ncbi:salicylate hydroxylase [Hypoxylon trugodes]|uniref:salicylate hydroxylase n=1 Tax=Hypoxylon trugodes TaxID=326681 RepID=UPI00218F34C0|nr:salicylate hydroxylase [Hypoxylon trugodes]KAI1386325.1 salicylate hydroxylase [Hypoxylon trugodes]
MDSKRIRIAIIGGGLAGASVANGLFHLPHIEVHVFESAPEFYERGAAAGISLNAQRALNAIIPLDRGVLQKAGAVPMNSSRIILGSGKDAGTVIFDLRTGVCVHRASLLRELLSPLPKEILHPNKQLVAINPKSSGVELVFKDGSKYEFDAVIGVDGIFSFVRQHVFRDTAPGEDYGPSPAGFWDCRNLVPLDKAKSTLGKDLFEDDRRYSWVSDGAFIIHDILEDRTMVQCIVSAIDKKQSFTKSRKSLLVQQDLKETLNTWLGGPIASGMIDLTLNQPDTYKYSQWEHKATPTYFEDRVCLVGDAAHASSSWMGAGAGIAIEDAISKLFANISSPKEITAAFKAYDTVRRLRCQRVVDSSRETGLLFCGKYGLDVAELRAEISTRWNFILDLDMEAHQQEAMECFTQYKDNQ